MASPAELSLECKPHSYSLLLKSVGDQTADQTQKLEEFLARLEEERLKIDAFKRELPLCMQLLNNAMETSRQQLQSYIGNQGPKPVLEQFIPLQTTAPISTTCEGSDDQKNIMSTTTTTTTHTSDKANWMISAQLWSTQATADQMNNNQQQSSIKETTEIGFGGEKQQIINGNQQIVGLEGLLPELTLASSEKELEEMKKNLEINSCGRMISNNGHVLEQQGKNNGSCHGDSQGNSNNTLANNNNNPHSTHRKARRCWSPDLHRRFVNALQMLGGSQVATPKQIRELMKVDGLTNDEVKSHLQKYRLHTRRPSPSPQVAATGAPQLVVLGGIWVPPEYAAAHGGATAALYGTHSTTHHASPHYCAAPLPQEFYHHAPSSTPAAPHHQLHHHHHHPLYNQIHVYQQQQAPPPPSQTQNSPESDFRGGGSGGLSESMEDGKSESGSWKGDSSGENGGRRKALVVREEGEESNGSEITLKF